MPKGATKHSSTRSKGDTKSTKKSGYSRKTGNELYKKGGKKGYK